MPFIADAIQPNPQKLKKRLGAFSVALNLIDDHPDEVRTALAGCVIVRAEAIWHTGVIDYVAMHEDFEIVPDGNLPPLYLCELTKQTDGSVSRVWKKT